eukprot:3896678-Rhodomonas_salina.2
MCIRDRCAPTPTPVRTPALALRLSPSAPSTSLSPHSRGWRACRCLRRRRRGVGPCCGSARGLSSSASAPPCLTACCVLDVLVSCFVWCVACGVCLSRVCVSVSVCASVSVSVCAGVCARAGVCAGSCRLCRRSFTSSNSPPSTSAPTSSRSAPTFNPNTPTLNPNSNPNPKLNALFRCLLAGVCSVGGDVGACGDGRSFPTGWRSLSRSRTSSSPTTRSQPQPHPF